MGSETRARARFFSCGHEPSDGPRTGGGSSRLTTTRSSWITTTRSQSSGWEDACDSNGGCDMAIAFPQFARDEGLVCAVDDDGDSLVCWDSCPWNPMTVYASQLERVETAEPEGNNDEEPNDEQPED